MSKGYSIFCLSLQGFTSSVHHLLSYAFWGNMNRILSGIILTISLSLVEGVTVIHMCEGQTSSYITCNSEKVVVLIKEVFRVGELLVPHCGFRAGDRKDYNTGATKTVWNDCNLRPNCNVTFVPSSSREFFGIHYECVDSINALSICQASHRLNGHNGYIHSPGYPFLIPSAKNPTRCNCSATALSKTATITVKVFNTFSDGKQTLSIKWDSSTESLIKQYPHFKEYTHSANETFSIAFSSDIRDSTFWLEYRTDTPLRIHCNNKTSSLPFKTTTSMPKPTTTKTITSTTTTADSSIIIILGVFLGVTVILIVILTTLLLYSFRMRIFARFCTEKAGDEKPDVGETGNRAARDAQGVIENEEANFENAWPGCPGDTSHNRNLNNGGIPLYQNSSCLE